MTPPGVRAALLAACLLTTTDFRLPAEEPWTGKAGDAPKWLPAVVVPTPPVCPAWRSSSDASFMFAALSSMTSMLAMAYPFSVGARRARLRR